MADLFRAIRQLSSVARVSNLDPQLEPQRTSPLNAVFWICPRLTGKGLRANPAGTGLTAQYVAGVTEANQTRLDRAAQFAREAAQAGIPLRLTAIFAAADALMLFPLPVEPPPVPDLGLHTRSNLEPFLANASRFVRLYRAAPWQSLPQRARRAEAQRLASLLPEACQPLVTPDFLAHGCPPRNLAEDFITRIFAGFALDGLTLRQGCYGPNPVILGVESPGVPLLQNAALARPDWLPVIQLH